jgi:hypothetical protein
MIVFTQTDCQIRDADRQQLLSEIAREAVLRDVAAKPSRRRGRWWILPIRRGVLRGVRWLRPACRVAMSEASRW